MKCLGRIAVAAALAAVFPWGSAGPAEAVDLSGNVTLDEADGVTRGHLQRVKVLIANRQWDETIDTLRQVADAKGEKVVAAAPGYYVRLRDYCHRRLAALPAEALAMYRGQVDAQAQQWLEQVTADGDTASPGLTANEREALLRRVVDHFYASSSGDEALWLLGEYALERGDYGTARGYWEQLIETPPAVVEAATFENVLGDKSLKPEEAELLRRRYQKRDSRNVYELVARRAVDPELMRVAAILRERGLTGSRGAYPGADQAAADVFARLILVSILEGSTAWAEAGLREFAATYPEATGRIAGRETNYAEGLATLLEESRGWPRQAESTDWPTFAGNFERNRTAPLRFDIGRVKWRVPLTPVVTAESEQPIRRPGEDKQAALSYHPVVSGKQVFIHNGSQIFAYDLQTGGAAWGQDPVMFSGDIAHADPTPYRSTLGVPRFTLSVHKRRLYARLGPTVTSEAGDGRPADGTGYLACFNLDEEGRLLWNVQPPDAAWAFEGTPVADDEHVYVALRKGGVRPQLHVACLHGESGAILWRKLICSAETPGQGQHDEITHTLLTMVGEHLYINTNLGAVAALAKRDGAVRWVTLYPRAGDDPNRASRHVHRDLTPCVYDRGTLYVAPSDSRHILALDASAGLIVWENALADDVVHLLGVADDHLLASGDRLWRIHSMTGRITNVWPDESPKGFGRGVLVSGDVLWPTRTTIEVFSTDGFQRLREVELSTRDVAGGNLIPAGEYLLIASPDELVAFDRYGGVQQAAVDTSAVGGPIYQYPNLPAAKTPPPRRRGGPRNAIRLPQL
ncbi:MAG: PQQ-binding-like beta-propeller repeat protein [Planctomycetales bacterium]|nr:PQQ-binding-like beta-propeller repeat protein [Planctomycetales bacterium]